MSEGERRGRRTIPTSVVLRPARRVRTRPLYGLGMGVAFMITNAVGGLGWIAGLILVAFNGVLWLELQSRHVVMAPEVLVGRKFFRDRTYPLGEVTTHEGKCGIDIRHDGDQLLLRLPRGHAQLERMFEPSLSWTVALDSMESFLEDAKGTAEK